MNFSIVLYAYITDRVGSMTLNRTYNVTDAVSIEGFTDPLYPLNTRGMIERTIKKANMTINDSAAVSYMISISVRSPGTAWYVNNSDAPSFLEMIQNCTYQNDVLRNCTKTKYPGMGIESFVFFPDLQNSSLTSEELKPNSTMVDHAYFNYTFVRGCNVTGVTNGAYPWFQMDSGHNNTYGVNVSCPP
jgi:hypothetical protein